MELVMVAVVLGVDPAKRSNAVSVIDDRERELACLQVVNDSSGYRQLLALGRQWPDRRWAVEGATGVGAYLAQRLLNDGETVIDVPAKLSTRARIFSIGHGRKNDPADARTVAVVALRTPGLHEVGVEDETIALRLLSDRRAELVARRTATVNRLHQLLAELIPSGAGTDLTARTAKALLATVRPRDVAGRTRRALAVELVTDVTRADSQILAVDAQLAEVVAATGTTVTDIKGVGIVMAALILGEVGDIRRFPSKHHVATYTGSAPTEASSGEITRHRLSRAGNRRLNHALHVAGLSHRRYDDRGKAYYDRKLAEGKGKKGAMRCLERRLSDQVYRHLLADARARETLAEAVVDTTDS